MSAILLLAVALYVVINAIKCTTSIDWSGMGVFVGLLLGGLTGMGFAKSQQKKYEIEGEIATKNGTK